MRQKWAFDLPSYLPAYFLIKFLHLPRRFLQPPCLPTTLPTFLIFSSLPRRHRFAYFLPIFLRRRVNRMNTKIAEKASNNRTTFKQVKKCGRTTALSVVDTFFTAFSGEENTENLFWPPFS